MNVSFRHSFHDGQIDSVFFIVLTKADRIDIWLKLVREDALSAILHMVKLRNNDTLHALNIWTKHLVSVVFQDFYLKRYLNVVFIWKERLQIHYTVFSQIGCETII